MSQVAACRLLLQELDDGLPFPKALSRNLGVDVARRLQSAPGQGAELRGLLASVTSAEDQAAVLSRFLEATPKAGPEAKPAPREKSEKYEFHVGRTKVTARKGECRILSETDFSSIDRKRLQRAIEAFDAVLSQE